MLKDLTLSPVLSPLPCHFTFRWARETSMEVDIIKSKNHKQWSGSGGGGLGLDLIKTL